eukprot:Nk52_evm27s293 gene=Nk52_evmTU27s293
MEVFVKTLTGGCFKLKVSPSETIMSIKAKIQRHKGIPIAQQHLLWRTLILEDECTLQDYRITNGCSLQMVLQMRGGPINTRRLPSTYHYTASSSAGGGGSGGAGNGLRGGSMSGSSPEDDSFLREVADLVDSKEEILQRLFEGRDKKSPVTLLIYKDGDKLSLIEVISKDHQQRSSTAGTTTSGGGERGGLDHDYMGTPSSSRWGSMLGVDQDEYELDYPDQEEDEEEEEDREKLIGDRLLKARENNDTRSKMDKLKEAMRKRKKKKGSVVSNRAFFGIEKKKTEESVSESGSSSSTSSVAKSNNNGKNNERTRSRESIAVTTSTGNILYRLDSAGNLTKKYIGDSNMMMEAEQQAELMMNRQSVAGRGGKQAGSDSETLDSYLKTPERGLQSSFDDYDIGFGDSGSGRQSSSVGGDSISPSQAFMSAAKSSASSIRNMEKLLSEIQQASIALGLVSNTLDSDGDNEFRFPSSTDVSTNDGMEGDDDDDDDDDDHEDDDDDEEDNEDDESSSATDIEEYSTTQKKTRPADSTKRDSSNCSNSTSPPIEEKQKRQSGSIDRKSGAIASQVVVSKPTYRPLSGCAVESDKICVDSSGISSPVVEVGVVRVNSGKAQKNAVVPMSHPNTPPGGSLQLECAATGDLLQPKEVTSQIMNTGIARHGPTFSNSGTQTATFAPSKTVLPNLSSPNESLTQSTSQAVSSQYPPLPLETTSTLCDPTHHQKMVPVPPQKPSIPPVSTHKSLNLKTRPGLGKLNHGGIIPSIGSQMKVKNSQNARRGIATTSESTSSPLTSLSTSHSEDVLPQMGEKFVQPYSCAEELPPVRAPHHELVPSRFLPTPKAAHSTFTSIRSVAKSSNIAFGHSTIPLNTRNQHSKQESGKPPVEGGWKRCGVCSKRLGLATTYSCKCGGNYCGSHRYTYAHDCTIDYKSAGKKLLQQQNPTIRAPKLPKL